jgi:5-methylcytosine-specific restriction protein A
MPRKACFVSTCPNPAVPGESRCAAHRRSNWDRYRPAHRDVYRTRQWTDLRQRVLKEQATCCIKGCEARSSHLDHITPLAAGGAPYDRSNVRGICGFHHAQRSSAQGAEAANRKRKRPPPP